MKIPTHFMKFYVDGACRRNGRLNPVAAAACCLVEVGNYQYKTLRLPQKPTPTGPRAEVSSIIMALRWALANYKELDSGSRLEVQIHSDSQYAVNCMNSWISIWAANGWRRKSSKEGPANNDLIQLVAEMDRQVKELGSVTYNWIPRTTNQLADKHCNEALSATVKVEGDYQETAARLVRMSWPS